jgi:MFS family permease
MRSATRPAGLFRNRDYVSLVTVQGVSVLGNQVMSIAMPLLTLALTDSPAHAGMVVALGAVPYVMFSLPAGALVDRWNRRNVLAVCNAVRAAVILWVPFAYATGILTVAHLYALSLIFGTAFVFFNIAELAALPQMVEKADLPKAGSVNAVTESTAGLVGPGLGGLLVGLGRTPVAGGVLAFLVAGVAYAVSVLSLLAIRRPLPSEREPDTTRSVRRDIGAGLRFLWQHRTIRRIAVISACLNLLFSPAYLAVIVLARDELHASGAVIGLIFSLGGGAGILGGLLAPRISRRVPFDRVIVGSLVVWAAAMPLLPLAWTPAVVIAGWVLVTLISPVYDVTQLSYRLSLILDELQGRVNSTFRFIAWGLRPVAIGIGGLAVAALGSRPTLWIIACGMTVLAAGTVLATNRAAQQCGPQR